MNGIIIIQGPLKDGPDCLPNHKERQQPGYEDEKDRGENIKITIKNELDVESPMCRNSSSAKKGPSSAAPY